MNIKSFITLYNTKKTDEQKKELVKSHITNFYIPYEKKANVAKAIINSSHYIIEKEKGQLEKRRFHIDSVAKYMLVCMAIVDLFTDIERGKNESKMLDDFNKLNELGILEIIFNLVNQRELKEFQMIVQMVEDDLIANEYEPHAFIRGQIERLESIISSMVNPIISNLDTDKIQDIINQLKINNDNDNDIKQY